MDEQSTLTELEAEVKERKRRLHTEIVSKWTEWTGEDFDAIAINDDDLEWYNQSEFYIDLASPAYEGFCIRVHRVATELRTERDFLALDGVDYFQGVRRKLLTALTPRVKPAWDSLLRQLDEDKRQLAKGVYDELKALEMSNSLRKVWLVSHIVSAEAEFRQQGYKVLLLRDREFKRAEEAWAFLKVANLLNTSSIQHIIFHPEEAEFTLTARAITHLIGDDWQAELLRLRRVASILKERRPEGLLRMIRAIQ